MKVKVTRIAFNELAQIHSHIARDNPEAALWVFIRIKEVIQRLGEFPYLARIADESGIRVSGHAVSIPHLLYSRAAGGYHPKRPACRTKPPVVQWLEHGAYTSGTLVRLQAGGHDRTLGVDFPLSVRSLC